MQGSPRRAATPSRSAVRACRHVRSLGSLLVTQSVRVSYTKWADFPHWEFDTTYLGEDEHGLWLAIPSGTCMSRPGGNVVLSYSSVLLVPQRQPYTAMFMARTQQDEPNPPVLYVDVTTVPTFDGSRVSAVDLGLDVIRFLDSSVVLDDEDEFEEHRVRYRYPADIVEVARAAAGRLVEDIKQGLEPFGRAADSWLRPVGGVAHYRP